MLGQYLLALGCAGGDDTRRTRLTPYVYVEEELEVERIKRVWEGRSKGVGGKERASEGRREGGRDGRRDEERRGRTKGEYMYMFAT